MRLGTRVVPAPMLAIPSASIEMSMPPSRGFSVTQATTLPSIMPRKSSRTDSATIWPMMFLGVTPSASIRPISRTRSKTAMTRVFTRPNESARKTMTTQMITKVSMNDIIVPRKVSTSYQGLTSRSLPAASSMCW